MLNFFSREERIKRIETRMEKKLRQQYAHADAQNGYHMSLGGGIVPFPTFEQWIAQRGKKTYRY